MRDTDGTELKPEVSPQSRSFSIRLTTDDQAALAELCDLYGLDRPGSIRRAIRQALASKHRLGKSGCFVPAGLTEAPAFSIRLSGKDAHE